GRVHGRRGRGQRPARPADRHPARGERIGPAVQHDSLRIQIGGTEVEELYRDLVCLEVELDDELAGMFRMTLALRLNPDGSWTYLDDKLFVIWQRVVVTAGLADDSRQLLTGFITHLR